jgi:hypothetical protein
MDLELTASRTCSTQTVVVAQTFSQCDWSLSGYGRTTKETHTLAQAVFFSLYVTVDMCLNKPVIKEFQYWLLHEHQITERRLVEPLLQKCLFLGPWEQPSHHSSIQLNMSHIPPTPFFV